MKPIVILLAILAIAKVGYQEYLYRTATNDVIISAYRNRAVNACQQDAKSQRLAAHARTWSHAASVKLVIGKSNLNVKFWQINDRMWNARFRNPYLFLVADHQPANVFCEYDIVHGAASVYRM